MSRSFAFIIPAILFFTYTVCEGLECYHCYSGKAFDQRSDEFIPCNDLNLNASNTWVCPSSKARCIWEVVEITATKTQQTWRTCSNGIQDPCDPKSLPPGMKMLKCTHCGTDKCNLYEGEKENENNSFTFNINANVNLYIRQ